MLVTAMFATGAYGGGIGMILMFREKSHPCQSYL